MRGWMAVAALAVLAAGCASNPAPVPLVADPEGKSLLEGEWVGEYSSRVTGRAGSITFLLVRHEGGVCPICGAESPPHEHAQGDVLMIPRALDGSAGPDDGEYLPQDLRMDPQVLRIDLVRVTGHQVNGVIEPYRDPETGNPLATTFEGSIVDDLMTGQFLTVDNKTGDRFTGIWELKRKNSSH